MAESRGELVEFLAYSGLRIAEANAVKWRHVDWERSELIVEGDEKKEGTKSRQSRRVPMIAELQELLTKIRKGRESKGLNDKVLLVNNAKAIMQKVSEPMGKESIGHHDMRHLFATTCIESGVDIPTIAHWLGHQDGGALAMKTYGHLRNEYSRRAADLVSFA
ncbi:MAG: site-specific integrase [Verrucomicrobiota bacterium]